MDGGAASGAAVASALNSTLRISQIIYELAAVGEQAKDLLAATKHVAKSLETTKSLRRQKSIHLDSIEKDWIDNVMADAHKTLNSVAALVEPVRVDMQTKYGKIGLMNRGLFVFRDSPKVPTQLTQLSITSQSLNTALNILSQREGSAPQSALRTPRLTHRASMGPLNTSANRPPTYEESEFLNRRRKSTSRVPLKTQNVDQIPEQRSPDAGTETIGDGASAGRGAEAESQVEATVAPLEPGNGEIPPTAPAEEVLPRARTPQLPQAWLEYDTNIRERPNTGGSGNDGIVDGRENASQYQHSYQAYSPPQQQSPLRQRPSYIPEQSPNVPELWPSPLHRHSVNRVYHPEPWTSRHYHIPTEMPTAGYPPINAPHLPGQSGLDLHLPLTPPETSPTKKPWQQPHMIPPVLAISPPGTSHSRISSPGSELPAESFRTSMPAPPLPLPYPISSREMPMPSPQPAGRVIPRHNRNNDSRIGLGLDLPEPSWSYNSPHLSRCSSDTTLNNVVRDTVEDRTEFRGPDSYAPQRSSLAPVERSVSYPMSTGRSRKYAWLEYHVDR